jgi:hypothetical protein
VQVVLKKDMLVLIYRHPGPVSPAHENFHQAYCHLIIIHHSTYHLRDTRVVLTIVTVVTTKFLQSMTINVADVVTHDFPLMLWIHLQNNSGHLLVPMRFLLVLPCDNILKVKAVILRGQQVDFQIHPYLDIQELNTRHIYHLNSATTLL